MVFKSGERPERFNSKFVTGVEIQRTGPAGVWLAWNTYLSCSILLGSSVSPSVKWDSTSQSESKEKTGNFHKDKVLESLKVFLWRLEN